jgi:hypothetical protein
METIDIGVTLGQPSLDIHDSFINALSYNDFPSQHRVRVTLLSLVRRYSNDGFFPSEVDSRQVVAASFAARGIRNHIRLSRVIMNLKIIVLD